MEMKKKRVKSEKERSGKWKKVKGGSEWHKVTWAADSQAISNSTQLIALQHPLFTVALSFSKPRNIRTMNM